jgi:hypothetical protein
MVYKFLRNLSRAHGGFQEQKKVLEFPIIIINYCIIVVIIIIIIINAYYNYMGARGSAVG